MISRIGISVSLASTILFIKPEFAAVMERKVNTVNFESGRIRDNSDESLIFF
jgi:hypothetical protein